MPEIPANFFTRTELQNIVLKTQALRTQTKSGEQQSALENLCTAAARIDGILADMIKTPHPVNKALDNPNGWTSQWLMGSITTGGYVFQYGQQVLGIPLANKHLLGTDRYKLVLSDGEVHIDNTHDKLKAIMESHLDSLGEAMSQESRADVMRLFEGDDCAV